MTTHDGTVLATVNGGHSVIACDACEFAHFWPKPTPEELAAYYAASFYETHSPPDWAEKEAAEEPYWRLEHADRLTAFIDLLGRPSGTLLDIGCGGGWLLSYAADHGWDVIGVEPSRSMWARAAKQVPIVLGTFPDADLGGKGPFDVVNLKLVMEHVAEPHTFLDAVRKVMSPGGLVCVEVPNDFNRLQRAVRAKLQKPPWWVVYPVHINYFTFETLERLLVRCGFQPLLREATYPMEWFLLQGVDYIGRDDVGRECHRQRMEFEMALEEQGLSELRRSFGRWLASHGIGREAIVYARMTS